MKTININNKKISQVLGSTNIFTSTNHIEYLVANTNCGKTTYLSALDIKKVIAVPTIIALKDIKKSNPTASVFYGEEKDLSNLDFIITTHASLEKLMEKIKVKEYTVILDEAHNLVSSSSVNFRNHCYNYFVDTIKAWNKVILTSGTPLNSSHPNLQDINYIKIESVIREQSYKLVEATDEYSYILNNVSDKINIIFLNSKNEAGQLGTLREVLLTKFKKEEILVYNALRKSNGEEMVETNLVPKGVKVIITTSVFLEAFNLNSEVDNLFVMSTIHPVLLHQLANRARTKAVGMIHIFQNKQKEFDITMIDNKIKASLIGCRAQLTALLQMGYPDELIEREIKETNSYAGEKGFFIYNKVKETIEINHFAIDNIKFQKESYMFASDNKKIEDYLTEFNWVLSDTVNDQSVIAKLDEFKTAAKTQSKKDIEQVFISFDDHINSGKSLDSYAPKSIVENVFLSKTMYLLSQELEYSEARQILVAGSAISDSIFSKVKEALKISQEVKTIIENPLRISITKRFYEKVGIKIGDRYTREQIMEKMNNFYKSEVGLKDRMIGLNQGMDILKSHFEVSRTSGVIGEKEYGMLYKIVSLKAINNYK